MEVEIAVAVSRHGRNCFFVDHERIPIMFDCSIQPGTAQPYPALSPDQIKRTKYLFLSHFHQDHPRVIPWLLKHGFQGDIVATRETKRLMGLNLSQVFQIDRLVPPKTAFVLEKGISVEWGRSGHCLGSIWFKIIIGQDRLIYSGDYIENSLIYQNDPIEGRWAEVAIIGDGQGHDHVQENLFEVLRSPVADRKPMLFPVPPFGCNLELVLDLATHFPRVPIYADKIMKQEFLRLASASEWIKPGVLEKLMEVSRNAGSVENRGFGFYFICDPHLKERKNQALAMRFLKSRQYVIFTDIIEPGSFSDSLHQSGKTHLWYYAKNQKGQVMEDLIKSNTFKQVIPIQ